MQKYIFIHGKSQFLFPYALGSGTFVTAGVRHFRHQRGQAPSFPLGSGTSVTNGVRHFRHQRGQAPSFPTGSGTSVPGVFTT